MKKGIKIIFTIIVSVTVIFYWPKSFNSILDIDNQKIKEISITLCEPSGEIVEDEWGNEVWKSHVNVYKLDVDSIDNEHYNHLLSILNGTKYHSKLRNILPFELDISNQDFEYTCQIWISLDDDYKWINLLGDNRISISSKDEKANVYNMRNSKTLNELAKYVMEHGNLSEK